MTFDVKIELDQLRAVQSQLEAITQEFDKATSLSEELEAAIGSPFGDSRLRDKAREFEERWDKKRDKLNESLKKVHEHVKGVVDGFEDWDTEAAINLEPPPPASAPGPPGGNRPVSV